MVRYHHERRYDEVIRYVWRNPRRAKNGKEGRVSKAGHGGFRETGDEDEHGRSLSLSLSLALERDET